RAETAAGEVPECLKTVGVTRDFEIAIALSGLGPETFGPAKGSLVERAVEPAANRIDHGWFRCGGTGDRDEHSGGERRKRRTGPRERFCHQNTSGKHRH